jgi:hypothetical protein
MAQKTAWDGASLTEADINLYLMGEGGAWTTWTPTVTQSGSVTVTNTRSRFARYGRTIHWTMDLSVTGSGTGGNAIEVSLPVAAAASAGVIGGTGLLTDSSTSDVFPFIIDPSTTTTVQLKSTSSSSGSGLLGVAVFTAALASGDIIRASGTYEAAS